MPLSALAFVRAKPDSNRKAPEELRGMRSHCSTSGGARRHQDWGALC